MVSTIKDTLQKQLVKKDTAGIGSRSQSRRFLTMNGSGRRKQRRGKNGNFWENSTGLPLFPMTNAARIFPLNIIKMRILWCSMRRTARRICGSWRSFRIFFARFPDTVIAYGDEDEMDEKGVRQNPWLKPDWSPDTLISYFYFGGFFAVKKEAVSGLTWLGDVDFHRNLYDFVLKAAELTGEAGHIDSVLFHREKDCGLGHGRGI